MRQRPDVEFLLLTERPQRAAERLPYDWGDGRENVRFNVPCENQCRAYRALYCSMATFRMSMARSMSGALMV